MEIFQPSKSKQKPFHIMLINRTPINFDISKLSGRKELTKPKNIPPFYSVNTSQITPRAPTVHIGPKKGNSSFSVTTAAGLPLKRPKSIFHNRENSRMGTTSLLKNIDLDNLSKDSNEEIPFTKYYNSNLF